MKTSIIASRNLLIFSGILLLVLLAGLFLLPYPKADFDGNQALQAVKKQLDFGPRIPGSPAHQEMRLWAADQFQANGWKVIEQTGQFAGQNLTNLIAKRGSTGPLIILGAHYDTRQVADQDPSYPGITQPVPGANDGASGVAVLLELSRSLELPDEIQVWLVLFDGEDQGHLPGWDWILGSRLFIDELSEEPAAVVIVDMVGDADLNLKRETNSNSILQDQIWQTASKLGFEQYFLEDHGYSMLDDHTPFLERGFPALDIIDFDYPYWHTSADTYDRISAESLQAVGRTVETWLEGYPLP